MRRNQLAATNMLCLSATVDIIKFLTHSGSGNVAYIMMLDSPNTTKQMSPTYMAGSLGLSQQET